MDAKWEAAEVLLNEMVASGLQPSYSNYKAINDTKLRYT